MHHSVPIIDLHNYVHTGVSEPTRHIASSSPAQVVQFFLSQIPEFGNMEDEDVIRSSYQKLILI